MQLVLATRNEGKLRELTDLLAPYGFEVLSLSSFSELGEIIEDGATFKENAIIKAAAVAKHTGLLALADDSGLEVDALDGAPGVYSSRFAGEGKDDLANNRKLLELLAGLPPERRTARFQCVVAIAWPDGSMRTSTGTCEGVIAESPRGEGGFGYDPLFYVPEYGKTFAELDAAVKNKISHRAKALAGAVDILSKLKN
ncbi:MAG: XTP/dITP diphosphatase [Peptococcaceae bacterium]|jgi:XTP/dITP diphosphohydrolase|nr:XTP/dITP diphosphatase [Peptococcaceae bacterium]